MLSHVSQVAIKKGIQIRNERIRVTAHFHEQGSVLGGTAEGSCEGFEVEFSVESDEPPEAIAELARLAHQMCFTQDAISRKVEITKKHFLNGQPFDPRPPF
jgi:uncharacterized OsmC-like protein